MASTALTWAVAAGLGAIAYLIKKIIAMIEAMQVSVKSLVRSDLVRHYHDYRDNGNWISDGHRDGYHALVGANGYIDDIRDKIIAIPNAPSVPGGTD